MILLRRRFRTWFLGRGRLYASIVLGRNVEQWFGAGRASWEKRKRGEVDHAVDSDAVIVESFTKSEIEVVGLIR